MKNIEIFADRNPLNTKVLIDNKEIKGIIRHIDISLDAEDTPLVILYIIPEKINIQGNIKIKKVSK